MTDKSPPRTARSPLWLRLLLFVSLALNLLVAGVVAGHILRDGPDGRVPRVDRMGGPMTFALSPEDRREIGHALRDAYREKRPTREQIMAEYQGVIEALRSDPFDRRGLQSAFDRQLASTQDRVAIGQEVLMQRITTMSDAERHAFADRLEEGLRRHGERREHGDRRDRGRDDR